MRIALLALFALAAPVHGAAPTVQPGTWLEGRVERVYDGDTITVRADSGQLKVRLAQIDAPELAQPWGPQARQALSDGVGGRRVRLEVVDTDRYGRLVCEVYRDEVHVNRAMVRDGHAWAYTRYATDTRMAELERDARAAPRGLWTLPLAERDAPWIWRRAKRERDARTRRETAADPATFACGAKRTCAQMSSCAEARFHLETCRLDTIDGDGDGVPCEALCGR